MYKLSMEKKKFRIGGLAQELGVKKFVIRFWEKEFELTADRSIGGQRFYTDDDLKVFYTIKDLLYSQGFTIAGAKLQLKNASHKPQIEAAERIKEVVTVQEVVKIKYELSDDVRSTIADVKRKLLKLQQLV